MTLWFLALLGLFVFMAGAALGLFKLMAVIEGQELTFPLWATVIEIGLMLGYIITGVGLMYSRTWAAVVYILLTLALVALYVVMFGVLLDTPIDARIAIRILAPPIAVAIIAAALIPSLKRLADQRSASRSLFH